jgi:hypothetical protein
MVITRITPILFGGAFEALSLACKKCGFTKKLRGRAKLIIQVCFRTPSIVASVTHWARPYDKAFVRVAGSKRAQTGPLAKLARRTQVFGAEFLDLVLALYARHPMLFLWASSNLPQSCPKNGDVPKFPFPTVAAVVPSAGTITL